MEVGLCDLYAVCETHLLTFEYLNQSLGNLVPEPISTLYLYFPPVSLCVCMCNPLIVVRQRLGKNVPAATNTHATREELLDASFSMRSVSYQMKIGDKFFLEHIVCIKKVKR
jgi:hypothetical protein